MARSANNLLAKVLLRKGKKSSLAVAVSALAIGLTLLLLSVLLWWNFNELLHGTRNDDSLGSAFLTISKKVTNENMGHPEATVFSGAELSALRTAPEVEATGPVTAAKPRVWLSMELGANNFSTILVLEAVPESFMDRKPAEWDWQPGQVQVPIILSSSFLNLYNYAFAPSQGLPQLSEEAIRALPFKMNVALPAGEQSFVGHVVGFSDRITSVLAPESFVKSINALDTKDIHNRLSRVILKIKDPSRQAFADFLASHGYSTNTEQMRLSKLRTIVEVIAASVGLLALLLLGVSCIVFILFIELTIARSVPSVHRLLEQGYAPGALTGFLTRKFLPLIFLTGAIGITVCIVMQLFARAFAADQQLSLAPMPGLPVWMLAVGVLLLLMIVMRRAIHSAISKIG